ncbi:hypothetical protein TNCT_319741 [Trichonephila clavata]|uniref:Uncharacterized protein n=1 Tax=Trichonephila clavata TaxID=2740835 RepID=A0A8X6GTG6_TRICU|nr:hypothetical protein TNCT_319741 [Trichonephila clavata]
MIALSLVIMRIGKETEVSVNYLPEKMSEQNSDPDTSPKPLIAGPKVYLYLRQSISRSLPVVLNLNVHYSIKISRPPDRYADEQ